MAATAIGDTVRNALERLSHFMQSRDLAILDEFDEAAGTILIGSEPGEIARGKDELARFFAAIFSGPSSVRWEWDTLDVDGQDDTAWFFAEGYAILTDERETRLVYRLSGVLVRTPKGWRWRLFHGSEPLVARA
ncbi:MAG TPA: nuclear transport factor 2 family protein [Arsenicitalea sp.]|jgi:ketosteroid isomerase-like protein|nr:nuclear transport factor 2 family protein [Arsenicitalea sp.]